MRVLAAGEAELAAEAVLALRTQPAEQPRIFTGNRVDRSEGKGGVSGQQEEGEGLELAERS